MRSRASGVLRTDPGDGWAVLGGGAVATVAVVAVLAFVTSVDPDTWVPALVLLVLSGVSIPLCLRASRRPGEARLRKLLLLALVLKLLFVFPRYLMNEVAYDGTADAGSYHAAGQTLYENVHQRGEWSLDGSRVGQLPDETKFVGFVVGGLYLVLGTSQMSGYLVFAWISWLGLMCFLAAFRVAHPEASPRLAALLLLLVPSLLYWPSSIGKEAVMLLGLGLMVLGAARVLTARRALRGAAWFAGGGLLIAQVRPHLLLIVAAGAIASLLVRRPAAVAAGPARPAWVGVAVRVLVLVGLVPLLLAGVSRMDEVFGAPAEQGSVSVSVADALDHTAAVTATGGSQMATRPVRTPLDLPIALVGVTYRPFLFEARSLPSVVSALEGTVLLLLTLGAARWIWRVGPVAVRHPFDAFCAAYVLAFVFAFSNIGNAGILARQRVQMLPVLALLVAAAAASRPKAVAPSPAPAPVLDLTSPRPPLEKLVALP